MQYIDRSKSANAKLYRYFKEQDLSKLTDEEFAILKKKMDTYYTLPPTSASFVDFFEDSNITITEENAVDLNIYKRKLTADHSRFSCFDRYARIFSLCRTLGITNIYDIGCGHQLQAFLLVYAPEMNYTGIDENFTSYFEDFRPDPAYLNWLFKDFTGSDRIQFIKSTYPSELSIKENNIAISIGAIQYAPATAAALSRDFERIFIDLPMKKFAAEGIPPKEIVHGNVKIWENPYEEYCEKWKDAMPGFTFYPLGGSLNYLFATKIPEDKIRIKRKYKFIDNRPVCGLFDISWYNELLIPSNG